MKAMEGKMKAKMTRAEKIARTKADRRIGAAFRMRLMNTEINVMDISKIYAEGHKAIAEGVDDVVLGDRIYAFVQSIAQVK